MTKLEVLTWGVQHIAANHKAECSTDYEEFMSMSIYKDNVPTFGDAQMMCEDLGIESNDCYVDHLWKNIVIDIESWLPAHGQEEYTPTGHELWKRYNAIIGECSH